MATGKCDCGCISRTDVVKAPSEAIEMERRAGLQWEEEIMRRGRNNIFAMR